MYPEAKGETQNNILLNFGELVSTFAINNFTRGKIICCGLRCVDAHYQQKDLNSAELETVTTSRSPMTVITVNGEVQTNEEATVYVRELDIFLTVKVLENTPAGLSEGKLCDEHEYSYEWINGQNHIALKTGLGYSVIRRTSFLLSFLVYLQLPQTHLLQTPTTLSGQEVDHSDHHPAIESSESVDRQARGDPYGIDHHPAIVSSERVNRQVRGDRILLKHQKSC